MVAGAALHSRRLTVADLSTWAKAHGRRPGIARLRGVIAQAEPLAESPMESRLRMALVLGGAGLELKPRSATRVVDYWGGPISITKKRG